MGLCLVYVAVGLRLNRPRWETRLDGLARAGNLVAALGPLLLHAGGSAR